MRDKVGSDKMERVDVVKNNKILDTFLKVDPIVFINGLDVGVKQREESHDWVHTLERPLWSPLITGCSCP